MGMRLGIWQIDPFLFILLSEVLKFLSGQEKYSDIYLFVLSNLPQPWILMCDKSQCPFTIPYSTYLMINHTDLCECSLTVAYLPSATVVAER